MPISAKGRTPLRVAELFAGVGGFRLGLESCGATQDQTEYQVVWSNQFEPGRKRQEASDVYVARWGTEGHSNEDIAAVVGDDNRFAEVLARRPDMLVGGFPCQDYSVAKPASQAAGLVGKKGVLWWPLHATLKKSIDAGQPIKYLMLENVDRLLNSPSTCRGRDFAVIIDSLNELGYAVEWRVVNAADYGSPQRRRRVFIVAYHRSTAVYARAQAACQHAEAAHWLGSTGVVADGLPVCEVSPSAVTQFALGASVYETQTTFRPRPDGKSPFENAGLMVDGQVWTARTRVPDGMDGSACTGEAGIRTLGDVIARTGAVPESFYLDESDLSAWHAAKGAKSVPRVHRDGHEYTFSEGAMAFPDPLDRPSRTIITSEGGAAASRTRHVVRDATGRLRRLTPDELEHLNGFPRGHTALPGVSDARRAFLMGNALVVGVVRALGQALCRALD